MIDVRKLKWSSFNQAVCGLRFFFKTTCPQSWHVDMIPFGKRPKKLPAVLSGEEVNRLLSCVKCHKHRTFLLLQYACGLRLNEAAHLKISDIDSQRMQLRVDSGKGQKTRMVPMSPRLLTELREYWKAYRPAVYLFPGKVPDDSAAANHDSEDVQSRRKGRGHSQGCDARTHSGILMRPDFWKRESICWPSVVCWGTPASPRRWFICTCGLCIWDQHRVPSTGCRFVNCPAGCSRRATAMPDSFTPAAKVHAGVCQRVSVTSSAAGAEHTREAGDVSHGSIGRA